MERPINSGSYYFNDKGTISVFLLRLVNADYKFIFIDVGCNGRISDDGVFHNSPLLRALLESTLSIPSTRYVEPCRELQYVIAADDAFPLKNHIIKSYALRNLTIHQWVFNYHLSRAWRIVGNTFGILASPFRVFFYSDAPFSWE